MKYHILRLFVDFFKILGINYALSNSGSKWTGNQLLHASIVWFMGLEEVSLSVWPLTFFYCNMCAVSEGPPLEDILPHLG